MPLLTVEFGADSLTRTLGLPSPTHRRTAIRRLPRPQPAMLDLFALVATGPMNPPDRKEQDVERWDGLS